MDEPTTENKLEGDVMAGNPVVEQQENSVEASKPSPTNKKKRLIILAIVALVALAGVGAWLLTKDQPQVDNEETATITNFEDCVAAGYPIMESFPEQCSVPGGQTFVNDKSASNESSEALECGDGLEMFANKDFGAAFCYPSEWGSAAVMDAKIDAADTGYREAVRFSANTQFIVGGVSEDWTTTVGRGVGCQEPSNKVAELGSYNIEWHDFVGEGMGIEFALRSLESSEGGYDITETVSSLLEPGVCVQGHRVINGSRYRVLSAAFYRDFSEASGITTPKAHLDNSTVLFSETERQQLSDLLESAVSY